jgi:hypothetical protein
MDRPNRSIRAQAAGASGAGGTRETAREWAHRESHLAPSGNPNHHCAVRLKGTTHCQDLLLMIMASIRAWLQEPDPPFGEYAREKAFYRLVGMPRGDDANPGWQELTGGML